MDNCWFVLKQSHYPPPTIPENGIGVATGPICLGHVVPEPRLLDNVINRKAELKFPPDMPIYPTTTWELQWEMNQNRRRELSAEAGFPATAGAGVTVNANAGLAFQKSVKNFWDFESLETFIVQPTTTYIEDSLDEDEVVGHIRDHKHFNAWSIYMVTGLIIARGAKGSRVESEKSETQGGPQFDVTNVGKVGFKGAMSSEGGFSMSAQRTTDFVWAVRLAKVSKGILDKKWTFRTFTKGATFGLQEHQEQKGHVKQTLSEEGLGGLEKVGLDDGDGIFVLAG